MSASTKSESFNPIATQIGNVRLDSVEKQVEPLDPAKQRGMLASPRIQRLL